MPDSMGAAGIEPIKRLIVELLARTQRALPETAVKNELELLAVRLLHLAHRKQGDATAQIRLAVDVLKFLRPAKYATLDATTAQSWTKKLDPDVFADATAALEIIDDPQARSLFFQIGTLIARADGFVSWEEQQVLRRIRGATTAGDRPKEQAVPTPSLQTLLEELD